ncbi:hypothetical protein BDQ12DRAFT_568521, partial [Crucibulum laeve]
STLSPTWLPPKSPLAPHRLAKLANALGVSTPVPAVHSPNSFLSRSYSESAGHMEQYRRSPTPSASTASFNPYAPSTSKYLLHVIPPLHLPHDSDTLDDEMTPPPANASGYHTQFRRGTLVPMYATLQAQLGVIAKEYALPSTAGLILYLVSSTPPRTVQNYNGPIAAFDDEVDEPGPRISEDIWKHLWTRVLRVEQREDNMLLPSRSATPAMISLGMGLGGRSTPHLPQEPSTPLRPLISSPSIETPHPQPNYPFTTSPSTPSSVSDLRSNSKSAPPSSSPSEPDTPDTSVEDSALRADSFDLPGLRSPSLIPILAKVEFDVDRRRAGWYEPWLRSRRVNHAKRAESRAERRGDSVNQEDEDIPEGSHERKAPMQLLIGRKQTSSPISIAFSPSEEPGERPEGEKEEIEVEEDSYEQLPEFQDEDSESESEGSEEDELEDATARVASFTGVGADPLNDVFGTDADNWAELHDSERRASKHASNPNVVPLALTGADMSALPDINDLEDDRIAGKEEDEVQELLDQMSRPQLSISIPPSPPDKKRSSSPSQMSKRHIPPPLVLVPQGNSSELVVPAEPTPISSGGESTHLAYLSGSSPQEHLNDAIHDGESDEFDELSRVRSPEESEKRGGAVFDDLDLGLDPTEDFDDNDPNDRRRSQFLMRAQLDEIERTMAQLSPRILKANLEEDQNQSFTSMSLSPGASANLSLSGMRNSDFFPSSPRLPQHPDPVDADGNAPAWPATPFASLKDSPAPSNSGRVDGPPSPPRLAVNGVTTSAPKSYMSNRTSDAEVSAETVRRKRELEEEQALYPPLAAPSRNHLNSQLDSPVIPLSPDPFGRYPSTPEPPSDARQSISSNWDTVTSGRGSITLDNATQSRAPVPEPQGRSRNSAATSRFSADSFTGELEPPSAATKSANRTTLMSVKNIKKLWRKSKDKNSTPPTPTMATPASAAPSSGRASPNPPVRPERPSQENMDLPDVPALPPGTPTYGRFSPQPIPVQSERRPSQDQHSIPQNHPQQLSVPFSGRSNNPSPIIAAQMQPSRSGSGLDRLHFDQESPYPIRRSPPVRYSPRPPSPPQLPSIPEKEKISVRKSILKWKSSSTSNVSQIPPSEPQPRSSFERTNMAGAPRGRRPSVINFGSTRSSVTSPDIPPSPQIPEHFINGRNAGSQDYRNSKASRLTASSYESSHSPPQKQQALSVRSTSPPRSMTSSRDSGETRPSFDASQFEIVSPKLGSTLSYPYHGLDHD